MRYIGNKSKLIPFLQRGLERLGILGTTACDPFAGTAAVARFLKQSGYTVVSGDVMSFSHALQWAYVVVDDRPRFEGLGGPLRSGDDALTAVLESLNRIEPERGFIYENYSPDGEAGAQHDRRYFTPENAGRIDAVRRQIRDWRNLLTDDEHYVLLTALLEAADRIANTTGVYAAHVKSWQPNALKPLKLRVPRLVLGTGLSCRAHRSDANDLLRTLEPFDLLYLDPPYNTRQYPGYYHIPEVIAEGWYDHQPNLRGKTGLPDDLEKRSDWSRRRHCERVFERLVNAADCRHVLLSYNSEGIIPEEHIERVLRDRGNADSYRRLQQPYKRYRSDRDGRNRRYKGDRVTERLYYVRID